MPDQKLKCTIRSAGPSVNVIDIEGEISSLSEKDLSEAYAQATQGHIRTVLLNFSGLEYMNSLGIGLLVMLLIRARRENRRILGYGLSDHYRHLFKITRLDEAIPLYENEANALAFADPMDLPERES